MFARSLVSRLKFALRLLSLASVAVMTACGPSSYFGSLGTQNAQVAVVSVTVTPAAPVVAVGLTQAMTAIATYQDGTTQDVTSSATWASSDVSIATLGANGIATGVAPGSADVTATFGGIASPAVSLAVTTAQLVSLAVTPPAASIAKGLTQAFHATGTYTDGSTQDLTASVLWVSDATSVAAIGVSTGIASGAALGNAGITARLGAVISPSAMLSVSEATLASLAVTPASGVIANGDSRQFTATGTYTDGSTQNLTSAVTWTSGTPAVATLSAWGRASGVAAGSSAITAQVGTVISPAATLTVTAATLRSIAVSPAAATVAKGRTQSFTALGTYSDGSTLDLTGSVIWYSSSASVATIGASGIASTVNVGSTAISAQLGSVSSPSASLSVTAPSLVSLAVAPAGAVIAKGESRQFTATGTYTDGSTQNLTSSVTWASATPAVATVTAFGRASGIAAGSSDLTAQMGAVVSPAVTLTVTTAKLNAIAISPASATLAKGLTQAFVATGTYSDGSTQNLTSSVTWSSITPGVTSVDAAGVASALSVGSAGISAQLGSVTSPAASLTVVGPALVNLGVSPSSAIIALGQSLSYVATGTYTDGSTQNLTSSVTWTSNAGGTASIDASGLAKGLSAGDAGISARLGAIVSPLGNLTVTTASLVSLAVTPAAATKARGLTESFTATGTYSDGSTGDVTGSVIWVSSATNVATIGAGNGIASAVNVGSAGITAQLGSVVSPAASFTVIAPTLVSLAVTPASPVLAKGESRQFTATGTYTDGSTQNLTSSVTWASDNTSVATLTTWGRASGVADGSAAITAVLGGIVSPPAILTVTSATLVAIAVSPPSASVAKGLPQAFTATGTYSDGSTLDLTTTVTWSSTAPTVATIDATGSASTLAAGNTGISAQWSGVTSAAAALTVAAPTLVSLDVDPASAVIAKGENRQFTATGTYTDGSTQNLTSSVTWASSFPGIATVTSFGRASGVADGTTYLTAQLGSVISPSSTLVVTSASLRSIAISPSSASLAKGLTQAFTAIGTYSDGSTLDLTGSVTWASATASVASIDATGLATALSPGSAALTAQWNGITSPAAALTVTGATLVSLSVTPGAPSLAKGNRQSFTATGTYTDGSTQNLTSSVTWASSLTAVATIDSSGVAQAISEGSTAITAQLGAILSPPASLLVTSPVLVSLALTPGNPTVAKGLTQQFFATGTLSDGSTADYTLLASWSSDAPSVASISATGLATGQGIGSSNIVAQVGAISSSPAVLVVSSPTVVGVAVTPGSASIAKGLQQAFTATATLTDLSTVDVTLLAAWSSGTPSVAAISSMGLASTLAVGSTAITAQYGGVVSPAANLTVTAATLVSLAVSPGSASVAKGLTQQFAAVGTYTDGSTQTLTTAAVWNSGTSTVAAISSMGLASTLAVGSTAITAQYGGVVSPAANLTVTAATLVSLAVSPGSASVAKGLTQQFAAVGTYTDGSTQTLSATWVSSTNAVATIDQNGLATSVAQGSTAIHAQIGAIQSPNATLTVTAPVLIQIALSPSSASVAKGLTQNFIATGTYSDGSTQNLSSAVSWSSSVNGVATINAAGLASTFATGSTVISIAAYNGISASNSPTLTVTAATLVSLAVTPASVTLAEGLTQQFTATGTYTDASTQDLTASASWASGSTSVATISTAGLATAVGQGTSAITATVSGIASPSATLTVKAISSDVYIADTSNARIRRVMATSGDIATLAGTGVAGFVDGVTATSAEMNTPLAVSVDSSGNFYIADSANNRVRKYDAASGNLSTIAGGGNSNPGDGGQALQGTLSAPSGVWIDSAGANLYISDSGHNRIRKVVLSTGVISTIAGTGATGFSGDGGAGTSAKLSSPGAVVVDSSRTNLYFADTGNNRIRAVNLSTGVITTVAGNGNSGFSGDGGAATAAKLNAPVGVALDNTNGYLYIADTGNSRVRKVVLSTGVVTTAIGGGSSYPYDGMTPTSASLSSPSSVAVNSAGDVYFADSGNQRVAELVSGSGLLQTVAGNGTAGYFGEDISGSQAELHSPKGVAVVP